MRCPALRAPPGTGDRPCRQRQITGIEVLHADKPALTRRRQQPAIRLVRIDDTAARIGDDARIGDGIDQAIEEHPSPRQPADVNKAGNHPEEKISPTSAAAPRPRGPGNPDAAAPKWQSPRRRPRAARRSPRQSRVALPARQLGRGCDTLVSLANCRPELHRPARHQPGPLANRITPASGIGAISRIRRRIESV